MDKNKTAIREFFERFDETGTKKAKGVVNKDEKIKEEPEKEVAVSPPKELFTEKRERFEP